LLKLLLDFCKNSIITSAFEKNAIFGKNWHKTQKIDCDHNIDPLIGFGGKWRLSWHSSEIETKKRFRPNFLGLTPDPYGGRFIRANEIERNLPQKSLFGDILAK
jgi:hypothetical protein